MIDIIVTILHLKSRVSKLKLDKFFLKTVLIVILKQIFLCKPNLEVFG